MPAVRFTCGRFPAMGTRVSRRHHEKGDSWGVSLSMLTVCSGVLRAQIPWLMAQERVVPQDEAPR